MSEIDISIIVPTYNEAAKIEATVKSIRYFFDDRRLRFEVIVSDSGSKDRTVEIVKKISRTDENIRLVFAGKNGKGAAVKAGMLEANGRLKLFTDADLSTPIEEFDKLNKAISEGSDIAIGSRDILGAKILKHQPWHRELSGKLLNRIIQLLYVPGIYDTQCGFKLFKGDIARELFAAQKLDGFLFDVEILYMARKKGLKVAEIPVVWKHSEPSRVNILRDLPSVAVDLVRIKLSH
jgi:dolichyl-phosphate beta-glucosyltransferase